MREGDGGEQLGSYGLYEKRADRKWILRCDKKKSVDNMKREDLQDDVTDVTGAQARKEELQGLNNRTDLPALEMAFGCRSNCENSWRINIIMRYDAV